jgi:transcriptional regulator of aromatic amino acid metabolism
MLMNCPNCGSYTTEIRECDVCGKMGCHKCLKKKKNDWLCLECKSKPEENKENSDIFSMFG